MNSRKYCWLTALLLCLPLFIYGQRTDFSGLKIFINPGHGGHDSDDRHMIATDFWESEGNLSRGSSCAIFCKPGEPLSICRE
jgi:hypothetical protein